MKTARMAVTEAAVVLVTVACAATGCSSSQFAGSAPRTLAASTATSTAPAATDPTNGQPGSASPSTGTATSPSTGTGTATSPTLGTGTGTGTGTSPGVGTGTGGNCNLSGDFVQLQFPAAIQNCINQGLIYDFNSGSCFSNVTQASTYACSFAGVQQALDGIGMSSTQLLASQQPGAKLVGCGERRDGQTIVLQWWVPPPNSTSCTYSANTVIGTECYGAFPNGTAPSAPGNTPAGVEACVNAD